MDELQNKVNLNEKDQLNTLHKPIFSLIDDHEMTVTKNRDNHQENQQQNKIEREQKKKTIYSLPDQKLYKVEDVPDSHQQQHKPQISKKYSPKSQYAKTPTKQQQQSTYSQAAQTEIMKISHEPMNPEENLFTISPEAWLDYMKAVFIITEIIDPIQADKLLNYEEEKHVQFLFLASVRVYNYLKSAQSILNSHKERKNSLKSILEDINAYYQKAKSKFTIYSSILDEIRGRLGQKISRLFNVSKSVTGKQLYLDGFQGIDYKPEQQIQFTHCNYIEIVLNSKEIKNPYFKNHRLKKILKGYRKCCEISAQIIQNERQFKNMIDQIIIDQ